MDEGTDAGADTEAPTLAPDEPAPDWLDERLDKLEDLVAECQLLATRVIARRQGQTEGNGTGLPMTDHRDVLAELRAVDPLAFEGFTRTVRELLGTIKSERAGGDPLLVTCPLPECDFVAVGRDEWSEHRHV